MTPAPPHRSQLLTPPGAGAIAIVRITGADPTRLVDTLFQSSNDKSLQDTPAAQVRHGRITQSGEVIDDVVAYRTEIGDSEAVDLCCHGGIRVVERVLDGLEAAGAPLDSAGEQRSPWSATTRIEQEALTLLPVAATRSAVMFLAWQRENTSRLLAETAGFCISDEVEARTRIEGFLARAETARRLIHGSTVVLVGPPNSGKSTLFNRLVGRDATIVSPFEGTTRDWVSASIEVLGVPISLIDTAGRRVETQALERIAIESGRKKASVADFTIVVLDGSAPLAPEAMNLLAQQSPSKAILVLNKCDIQDGYDVKKVDLSGATISLKTVCVSASEGTGMTEMMEMLGMLLCSSSVVNGKPAAFTPRQVAIGNRVLDLLGNDAEAAAHLITEDLIDNCG